MPNPQTTDRVILTLPLPPSVNSYWRHIVVKNRAMVYVSDDGKRYQAIVRRIVEKAKIPMMYGRLRVAINVWPPDRRRRDLDNLLKCLLDSLQKAGAYKDDCQIDELEICRQLPFADGSVEVSIRELPGEPTLFDQTEDENER